MSSEDLFFYPKKDLENIFFVFSHEDMEKMFEDEILLPGVLKLHDTHAIDFDMTSLKICGKFMIHHFKKIAVNDSAWPFFGSNDSDSYHIQ